MTRWPQRSNSVLIFSIRQMSTAPVCRKRAIGSFIKDHSNKFTIATKAGIYRDPDTNVRSFNNSPEHLRDALEENPCAILAWTMSHFTIFIAAKRTGP